MKNMIKLIIGACWVLSSLNVYALPTAKLTIKVIDEAGEVITNARVGVSIDSPSLAGVGSDSKSVIGFTGNEGLFTVKGAAEPYIGFNVTKEGYYKTVDRFSEFTGVSGIIGFRRWQPWNPTMVVVLKKIKNPIPMYVAKLIGKGSPAEPPPLLPKEGEYFGFDLIAKDWVVPHGQGLHSDFVFKIDVDHYDSKRNYDATMTLKFTNPDDGIQSFYAFRKKNSVLRSAHHAPLTDYQEILSIRTFREQGKELRNRPREDQNYYFRVRTKRDQLGNIIEAHYGKIYERIGFLFPRENEKGHIYFSYYLNPNTNDTNVEFSSEKNLYPKPKDHRGHYRFKP